MELQELMKRLEVFAEVYPCAEVCVQDPRLIVVPKLGSVTYPIANVTHLVNPTPVGRIAFILVKDPG